MEPKAAENGGTLHKGRAVLDAGVDQANLVVGQNVDEQATVRLGGEGHVGRGYSAEVAIG